MVYLDNGATTAVCPEAAEVCMRSFDNFGNPSSLHGLGLDAKKALRRSAARVEKILNAEEGTLYFTSGATEANNWAIFGAAKANKGRHIVTCVSEHPSVLEPARWLEKNGYRVTYAGVDRRGRLNLDELLSSVCDETLLVSVMAVNNETGVINDIDAIGREVKRINSKAVFHVDGVCAFCKIPVDVNKSGIDLFSLSGHKLHAPKGVGGLYVRGGTRLAPLIYGGGQQRNMRSGTENTPFIEALAAAAVTCANEMKLNSERVARLKKRLMEGVLALDAEINGETDENKSSPYVLNVGFKWIKSQILINALEQMGVYAAAGSACSSGKKGVSHVISAMGTDRRAAEGSIRLSLSKFSRDEDISICLEALSVLHQKYRGKF